MTVSYNSDLEYASAKLSGSLVRHEGFPIYVHTVNFDGTAIIGDVLGGKKRTVYLKELDLEPVPLGFCNLTSTISYVSRCPKRNWKQGLRSDYLHCAKGMLPSMNSGHFINMILGIYPSLNNCIDQLFNNEVEELAFSRKFALGSLKKEGLQFFYKNNLVGYLDPDKSLLPKLDNKYKFLTESIEEVIYE